MPAEKTIHTGLDGLMHQSVGFCKRKRFPLKRLRAEAADIYNLSLSATASSDPGFDEKLEESRILIRTGGTGEALTAAFARVAEAAFRSFSIRPHIEQIMGALAIYRGYAIEMQTGEGKTLTAAIAAVIVGWRGRPCHIVTANDYLAKRDAEWMQPLYARCGLRAGYVVDAMSPEERRIAYDCDIAYSTGKELLGDFLRDKLAGHSVDNTGNELIRNVVNGARTRNSVMRGLHTAFVDEADSVLADEATVPLIISMAGKNRQLKDAVIMAGAIAENLRAGIDYEIDTFNTEIRITACGRKKIEGALETLPPIWQSYWRAAYLVRQALVVRHFYQRDMHYVVVDDKIVIVDEKTGRLMPDRSWSHGLHQAIEAKENIAITDIAEAHIRMSFQSFFRRYSHLVGLSGTLRQVDGELWSIYGMITVRIPPHLPSRLEMFREKVCRDAEQKRQTVAEEVRAQVAKGKAVLVGARSVKESETLYHTLRRMGIDAAVLNAHEHEREAAIIADAGQKAKVTIATNMAGRGTDIRVNADVVEAGGLHVIVTERHESPRVDWQLIGRTARQGMPGTARLIVSLEDEVMRKFAPGSINGLLKAVVRRRWGEACARWVYILFQKRAEKSRSRLRKRILEQDLDVNKALSFTKYLK